MNVEWADTPDLFEVIAEAREVLLQGAAVIEGASVLVDYNLACYDCLLGDREDARRRLARVFKREPGWREQAKDDPDLTEMDWEKLA